MKTQGYLHNDKSYNQSNFQYVMNVNNYEKECWILPVQLDCRSKNYLLARDLDTVVVLFVACINNRGCTLVMYSKLYMQTSKPMLLLTYFIKL